MKTQLLTLKKLYLFALVSLIPLGSFASYDVSEYKNILKQAPGLSPKVLELALTANECVKKKGLNKKNKLTILDYSKPSTEKRFWVLDLNKDKVIYSICAAHGRNSGNNFTFTFSNKPQSLQSSIGVFITGDTYYGKHGLSLELFGQEDGINSNAHKRRVVIHAANYVSESFAREHGRIGRSWGCPALNPKYTKPVIKEIKDGTVLFSYYPDQKWLNSSKYLNCQN
ncbi:MAG: murein L,D-transpeptidase catalytic domain family protein [Legionellales bacterium]|nr:murein L,D-transpeptidase catalytic domain family protein [Legionellales bacterium]